MTPSLIQLIAAVISVPLYLKGIGAIEYGQFLFYWIVIFGIAGADLGIYKTTIRLMSKYSTSKKLCTNIISAALWTLLFYFISISVVLSIVWNFGVEIFVENSELKSNASRIFPVLIAGIASVLIGNITNAIYESHGKFGKLSIFNALQNSVFSIIPALSTSLFQFDLTDAMIISVIIKFFSILLLVHSLKFLLIKKLDPPSIKKIKFFIAYGGGTFRNGLATYAVETADKYILPLMLSSGAFATYAIAFNLISKIRIFPESFVKVLLPKFAADSKKEADKNLLTSTWLLIFGCSLPVIFLIIFINDIFLIWIPTVNDENLINTSYILIVGFWINALAYPSYAYLESKGNPSDLLKIYRYSIPIYFILLYLLTSELGIMGCAIAWATRASIDALVLMYMVSISKLVILKIILIALMISAFVFIPDLLNLNEKILFSLIIAFTNFIVVIYIYRKMKFKYN